MPDIRDSIPDQTVRDYDRLREAAASVDLGFLVPLELSGEDRKGWLQGQATNDVARLTDGNGRSFCFCEATGGLLAVFDAWALPDRIVMTTERARSSESLARVERMTIMEDVAARDLGDELVGFSIQGPMATKALAELVELPALDAGLASYEGSSALLFRADRTGFGGWDVWLPRDAETARKTLLERFPTVALGAVEAARIEAGIPRWDSDMGARTLPPELGTAFESRHVSYKKGCYTGQEVLMRMHSRGHTNKTWVGLVAEAAFKTGDEVVHRGKTVGIVGSAAPSPDYGMVGAATLRNEAAHPGEVVTIGGAEAEVRPMPILRAD